MARTLTTTIALIAFVVATLVPAAGAHSQAVPPNGADVDSASFLEIVVLPGGDMLILGTWWGEYAGSTVEEGIGAFVQHRDALGAITRTERVDEVDLTCLFPEVGDVDLFTERARAPESDTVFFTMTTCAGTHIVSADADGIRATRPAGGDEVYGYSSFAADPTGGVQVVARAERFVDLDSQWTLYSFDDDLELRSATPLPAELDDAASIRIREFGEEFGEDSGGDGGGVTNLVGPDGTGWVPARRDGSLVLVEVAPTGGIEAVRQIGDTGCLEELVFETPLVRALTVVGDRMWVATCSVDAGPDGSDQLALSVLAFDSSTGERLGEVTGYPDDLDLFSTIVGRFPPEFSPDASLMIVESYRGQAMLEIAGSLDAPTWTAVGLAEGNGTTRIESVDRIDGDEFVAVGFELANDGSFEEGEIVLDGATPRQPVIQRRQFPSLVADDPVRILDTRPGFTTFDGRSAGEGRASRAGTVRVPVVGRGSADSDTAAVVVNVTAVRPDERGFLTVFPCGEDRPTASSVNFDAGVTSSNTTTSAVSESGDVCVYASTGTHLVVDMTATFRATPSFGSIEPARLYDSRPGNALVDGASASTGPVVADGVVRVAATGRGGIDDEAAHVVVNVTAVNPAERGFITAWDCSQRQPEIATVNFVAGETTPNQTIVALASDADGGEICVFTSAQTHVVVDALAWLGPGNGLASSEPIRFLDTRPTGRTFDDRAAGFNGSAGRRSRDEVFIFSLRRLPWGAANRVAALNIAIVDPSNDGALTVWPCDDGRPFGSPPTVSSVNFRAGRVTSNSMIVEVETAPFLCFSAPADYHMILDLITSR